MSTTYSVGALQVGETTISVGRIDVVEQYNGGWVATLVLSATSSDGGELTLPGTLATALQEGVVPGDPATVRLGIRSDETDTWVRTWPGFVVSIQPFTSLHIAGSFCKAVVLDVVNYLGGQRIWGGFRGHSAAEMVGGALSLAAGTEGRATLHPVVPGHPGITIHDGLRDALGFIPYALATGESLADWLHEFLGLLGIRMEMLAVGDGSVTIILSDDVPKDTPLEMSVRDQSNQRQDPGANGELAVIDIGAHRGVKRRATLLDDPTKGNFRRSGTGPIGTLVTGTEVEVEEAELRNELEVFGRGAELLIVSAESRQPSIRPGRSIGLTASLLGLTNWQVSYVWHSLRGRVYRNIADLMSAADSWHPRRPLPRATKIVPAYVDAGSEYGPNVAVPRDHLGRILVRFPFSPTMQWEDVVVRVADSNFDERITKDDFAHLIRQRYDSDGNVVTGDEYDEEETRRRFEAMDADDMRQRLADAASGSSGLSEEQRAEAEALADKAARDLDVESMRKGEFDEPHPGRRDDELDEEELEERQRLEEKRLLTYRYMAWKRALAFEESGGDYDQDGYVTAVDAQMSDELKGVFADPEKRAQLEAEARAWQAANADSGQQPDTPADEDDQGSNGEDDEDTEPPEGAEDLVDEYLRLFGEDSDEPAVRIANLQREAADQQWPVRVPLSVVQPMAGGLHGFVTAHRQGDACRVAVHNVMHAEIVGFQYRSDRDLKEGISGATVGIVVEHNLQDSWSGLVFRRTADPE